MAKSTRATAALDKAGIAHGVHAYDYSADVDSKGLAAAQALGIPALEQSSYAVVDLMARYQFTPQWSAQLNIGNALNKSYFAPTDDGMQLFWQAPRNATINVRYTF